MMRDEMEVAAVADEEANAQPADVQESGAGPLHASERPVSDRLRSSDRLQAGRHAEPEPGPLRPDSSAEWRELFRAVRDVALRQRE